MHCLFQARASASASARIGISPVQEQVGSDTIYNPHPLFFLDRPLGKGAALAHQERDLLAKSVVAQRPALV